MRNNSRTPHVDAVNEKLAVPWIAQRTNVNLVLVRTAHLSPHKFRLKKNTTIAITFHFECVNYILKIDITNFV